MTSLSDQFEYLVCRPINAAKRERRTRSICQGPYLIVLDGLDECEDRVEIATFIEDLPRRKLIPAPARIQASLLVGSCRHTSDSDISAAIAKEMNSRIYACDKSWPPAEETEQLVKHIEGSFIFTTTILRFAFDPEGPMDGHRWNISRWCLGCVPTATSYVVSTLALFQEPLSIAQMSDILRINPPDVIQVLLNLQSTIRVPGDDRTPITLWHPEKGGMGSGISASIGIPRR
ncbi:hypothetical protein NMY22_g8504 [Coprinellus aureogranulatus]|nr:hypothetical protein NMY22_g8504 [Coprinellus aureogranulatus]